MKKNVVSVITLLFLATGSGALWQQSTFADTTSSAITSPEQHTYSRRPAYDDTYFTYYARIIGYKSRGLWGFYSEDGVINIPPMYSDIEALNSQYIKVKKNGGWGVIDVNGYPKIQPLFESISTISIGTNDLFVVKLYGSYGVLDESGNQIVPIVYQSINKLDDSYLEIVQNYKHGVYALYEGREIISPAYQDIKMLNQWFMFKQENKWGILGGGERIIVPARYDDIKFLNNNYFNVKNNKVWGTVNMQGEVVIQPKYDKIEIGKAQYLKVKHNGKWGACTYDGNIVVTIDKGPLEINRVLKQLY